MTRDEASGLIHAYLDGDNSEGELQLLQEWIQADARNAREFARLCMLHDKLQSEFVSRSLDGLASEEPVVVARDKKATSEVATARRFTGLALALSLILFVSYSIWLSQRPSDRPEVFFAAITRVVDVGPDSNLQQGLRLGKQRVVINSGLVQIAFDDGVEVTLQGPAEYELNELGSTRLYSGLLSAAVPPEAVGFQVDTPAARVIDLGTRFGIRLDEDGASEVTVFDGEVDVTSFDAQEQRLLREGESLRVVRRMKMQDLDFNPRPFEKLWPFSSGIAGSTGDFELAPPWPRLRKLESDDKIFVRPEGLSTALPGTLGVNISKPGLCRTKKDLTPATLPEGKKVRSFMLHYRPEEHVRGLRFRGSITFDRPVLGLIVLQEQLTASKMMLVPGAEPGREVKGQRELELTGRPAGDKVELSADRKTVRLNLAAPGRFADLVRVILDAS